MKELIVPAEERTSCELVPDPNQGPLSLAQIFGNDRPVELEIGIGKGLFLMRSGLAEPTRNFLGIEYARKYLNRARQRIEKRPLPNVRVVHAEAMSFIREYLGDQSLDAVHLYFPDPWPKKRHHKRRIFNLEFLRECHRILKTDGALLIATDHQDYWLWMCEVLAKQDLFSKSDRLPEPPEEAEGLGDFETAGLTNYEIKYRREGRQIHRAGYVKQ